MKVVAFIVAMACALVSTARAEDTGVVAGDRDRTYANYTRDAATVGSGVLRLELRGFHAEDQSKADLDIIGLPTERVARKKGFEVDATSGNLVDILGSFGIGHNVEVGFDIPIVLEEYEFQGRGGLSENHVGDFSMYGKFKYKVADRWNIAGGLDLFTPTGSEADFAGTGDLGVNPFISTRYEYKRFSVGGHIGYLLYTGNTKDVFNYSADVIFRGGSTFALRTEITGRNFKQFGDTFNDVLVYPGIDLDFFDWVTIRPTGMFNLTAQSLDWGIGIGIATHFTLY